MRKPISRNSLTYGESVSVAANLQSSTQDRGRAIGHRAGGDDEDDDNSSNTFHAQPESRVERETRNSQCKSNFTEETRRAEADSCRYVKLNKRQNCSRVSVRDASL